MQLHITSPTRAYIDGNAEDIADLTKSLSYTNKANQQDVKRHYNNHWLRSKDNAAWELELHRLQALVHQKAIYNEDGQDFIRPGSIPYLGIGPSYVISDVIYPIPKKIPWAKPLPFELYDYQQASVDNLIHVKHGNVQICTGAGKSAIILKICRETGFRAAIVAPGKVVFDELLEKFEHHLGKNNVGTFGDGKKKLGKRFTICIGDSLANVKPGTEEWDFFNGLDMLAVDESHTWGADSLETLCHGIFSEVPYRFFFSATQTRGDGTEKLLQSIIGQTVYELTTADAKRGGYICDHNYVIVGLESSNPNYQTPDALNMKRMHFLRNENIGAFIAKLANTDAIVNKRQTLILVEELGQLAMLAKLLKVPYVIAHSESSKARLEELGLPKVKSKESVDAFNRGEAMVLAGTSCIATGTNIFPTHNTANWVGGSSEIKTKQGPVGRSVRLGSHNPWAAKCLPKTSARIFDFDVQGVYLMEKQLDDRIEFYKESNSEIRRLKLK